MVLINVKFSATLRLPHATKISITIMLITTNCWLAKCPEETHSPDATGATISYWATAHAVMIMLRDVLPLDFGNPVFVLSGVETVLGPSRLTQTRHPTPSRGAWQFSHVVQVWTLPLDLVLAITCTEADLDAGKLMICKRL